MAATRDEQILIEKIAIAKHELRGLKVSHRSSCVVECDPEGYGPCSCGATDHNKKIDGIIKILS